MHPPTRIEEVAELGGQHVMPGREPPERRLVDRFRMGALADLRELLRVSEKQQPLCRDRGGDGAGEGELAGLIDDEKVEGCPRHGVRVAEGPRGSPEHEPVGGCHIGRRSCPQEVGSVALLRLLADERRVEARRDDAAQHVFDRSMRLRDDTDLPPVIDHEICDHARPRVRLAGAGRALHCEIRVVERQQGVPDVRHLIATAHDLTPPRRNPPKHIRRRVGRYLRLGVEQTPAPLRDRRHLRAGIRGRGGSDRHRQFEVTGRVFLKSFFDEKARRAHHLEDFGAVMRRAGTGGGARSDGRHRLVVHKKKPAISLAE